MSGNKRVDPTLGNAAAGKADNAVLLFGVLIVFIVVSLILCCYLSRSASWSSQLREVAILGFLPPTAEQLEKRKRFVHRYLQRREWKKEQNSENSDNDEKEEERTVNKECSICLSNFEAGDLVSEATNNTQCHHIFHYECIHEWLIKKKECPMCRNVFLNIVEDDDENDDNNNVNVELQQQGGETTTAAAQVFVSSSSTTAGESVVDSTIVHDSA